MFTTIQVQRDNRDLLHLISTNVKSKYSSRLFKAQGVKNRISYTVPNFCITSVEYQNNLIMKLNHLKLLKRVDTDVLENDDQSTHNGTKL